MQLKLKNADVQRGLLAMVALCGGGNRLPTLAALKAARIKRALADAWEPVEAERTQLLKDNGKLDDTGKAYTFPTPEGRKAWEQGWKDACGEVRDLELETLSLSEIEGGYYRTAEGRKESGLDLSPEDLGTLVDLGLVQVMPESAPTPNPLGG